MATTTYTVQPGDSLSQISKKVYGDFSMVDTLASINKITNKDLITPGQKLIIPEVEEAEVIEEDESTGTKTKKYLWWLLAIGIAGGGYYAYTQYRKKKKSTSLSGPRKKKKRK